MLAKKSSSSSSLVSWKSRGSSASRSSTLPRISVASSSVARSSKSSTVSSAKKLATPVKSKFYNAGIKPKPRKGLFEKIKKSMIPRPKIIRYGPMEKRVLRVYKPMPEIVYLTSAEIAKKLKKSRKMLKKIRKEEKKAVHHAIVLDMAGKPIKRKKLLKAQRKKEVIKRELPIPPKRLLFM